MRELRDMHQSIDNMLKHVIGTAREEDKVYPRSDGNETPVECKRRSKLELGLPTVVTTPSEVRSLLSLINLDNVDSICDPWSGTGTIAAVFLHVGLTVESLDANPRSPAIRRNALDVNTYSSLRDRAQELDVIVCSPDFSVLDIAIPLAVQAVKIMACIHVPGDYLSNAHIARIEYFLDLRTERRLFVAQNLPKGPTGRSNQWLIVFACGINARDYLDTNMKFSQNTKEWPPGSSFSHRVQLFGP
jgi:hypothetical protein